MLVLNNIYDFRQVLCEDSEGTSVSDFGLLGEELDGTLLIRWNASASDGDAKSERLRTCVGSISQSSKKMTLLYCFDSVVSVIQASLNQDHSVLALVLFNEGLLKTQTGVIDNTRQYKCLLVPLASQESPVTLIYHSHLLHVQFRYSKKPAHMNEAQDVQLIASSQLLLCAHKETISLFNLIWEKSTESTFSYVLNYEFVETVVKAFQWAQWSLTEQCLYYVQFRPPLKLSDKEPDKPLQPMLTCLLFHDSIHYETVLNLPLDLPRLESFKTGISIHEDHPVSHKVSDSRLKLGVLTRSSGVVCVCHQYVKQSDFIEQQTDFMDCCKEEFVDLCYSVTLLHHGCTMTCTIPQVPIGVASSTIEFGFYGEDYVLAVLPGQFVHMLDVGLLHGPCNHILVQDSSFNGNRFHFLNSLSTENCPIVVSKDNCTVSVLSLSTDKLGHLLKNAQHRSTRQAIIHYLLVHLKTDPSAIFKQQLQLLLKEQIHLEMPKLWQEFLIGGTYAACKRSTSKRFLSLFPITLAEPWEPQIEQGPNQNVRITYVAVPHTSMTLLSPSQRLRAAECDIWSNLWRHLDAVRCCPLKRFSSQILRDQIMVSLDYSHQMESPATTPVGLSSKSPMKKLLEYFQEPCAEVVTNRSRRSSASSENSSSSSGEDFALPFPEKDDLSCSHFAQVVSTNLREMSVHVLKQFSDEQPSHVHQIATEYVANQLQMSRLLCSLLLADLDAPIMANHHRRKKSPYYYLSRVPKHKLLPIFRFLEQYQISTMGIAYPVPQGFSTFFSVLGFTCLDYRMYMQYVSRGALQVRSEVASYIMEVLDNEPHNAKIKLDILLRLPRHKAWHILESWDHPFSHSIQAREHSRALFGNSYIGTDQQGGYEMVPSVYPQEFLSSDSEIELTGDEKNHQKEMSMIWKASFPYNWTKTSCCPSDHTENGVTPLKSCINESIDTP